jgi:flagellar biosynthesis/type III secretory pathway M-ring protein FliF/YscJ
MSTVETMSQTSQQQSIREQEEMLLWDWQMISLVLAIIACLLFFIVTAIISINYVRQWRKIKKQFDTGTYTLFLSFLNMMKWLT